MAVTIKIDGLEKIAAKYAKNIKPLIAKTTLAIATEIHNQLAPYAPATTNNQPKKWEPKRWNSWYERGYGTRYVNKAGIVSGKRTSQTLGRRWQVRGKGLGARITNDATYSGFVYVKKTQARVHARHAWKTDEDIIKKIQSDGTVDKFIKKFIIDEIQK